MAVWQENRTQTATECSVRTCIRVCVLLRCVGKGVLCENGARVCVLVCCVVRGSVAIKTTTNSKLPVQERERLMDGGARLPEICAASVAALPVDGSPLRQASPTVTQPCQTDSESASLGGGESVARFDCGSHALSQVGEEPRRGQQAPQIRHGQ